MPTPDRIADLEDLLVDLNRLSAEVILPLFRSDHGLEDKGGAGGFDPVTQADRGAEAAIRRRLSEVVPGHGVIGEEYGEDRPDAEFVWVLDPVDGTRAFIAGLPLWTTLISLRWRGQPLVSSIGQPYLGEVFLGSPAGSRLIRGDTSQALRVRPCSDLSKAIIATTDPSGYFEPDEQAAWARVRAAARLARLGCDAYAYAMVAAGVMDLVIESRACKCWDIEAAAPLLAGAGGVVTDWAGRPIGLNGGQIAIAGDPACLEEALPLLAPAAD
ncbi:histidinol-phosphatase [Phenylobacterium sp.]|jgi:histidinol phosphatase-like enzyme (inositol monophosphatase family)|uniref:histidinol-phosphatase n=1 Tax=Phenylobacterium sp. TaxID=1871053 RepID=UPI0025D921F3|nr:histidinol-phosphatase [Phenylobacterium sp.]MCA3720216.1 histidinol-phosphatase [Phenylobacterium sp.]